ncbi:hypothetical protein XENOCAPTIV_014252, partial [Xenoophorus captivus]
KLQGILKPMMLRRLKEDVEKKLAPKEETIIEVELTNIQKKYYRAILEKNFSFLAKGAGQSNMPNLVNTMMELRKCCNHPYLIKGAEEKILEDFREVHSPTAADFHLQAMVQSAGKLVLIDKLLPKMKAGGHKVLIFSQMVRCLDILEDYLIQKSKPDLDRFVFLLCTRAGGLGINLTAADTCIIFDSDWNPQNDLQAAQQQLSKKEIEDLLRRGAYGAIMDEEDEGAKFCEEDIDQILQRRTKTITIESEGRGSTFAKNSLVIDTPRVRKQTRPFSATKDELAELSEGESDSDETKPKLRRNDRLNSYGRTECFRVEKNLLVYGWGRWKDVLNHGRFKKQLTEWDVESICRALLAYCLVHYRGDDKIKSFMWDLIAPSEDGRTKELQNHLGEIEAFVRRALELPALWWDAVADKCLLLGVFKHDSAVDPSLTIQPITEERASRTLYRVELLRQVREQVLRHPLLYERLSLCQMSSDLPVWWEAGTHDRDLLIGAAKHGVSRTDYHILRDPDFCFMAAQRNYSQVKTAQQQQRTTTPLLHPQYQAASSLPTGSPLPPPNQKDPDPCGVVPKVEPASEEEEVKERQGERWSPPQPPATPTGLEEKPILVAKDSERQMVAARTKPLTPNSTERKPKKASKRGRREARRGSDLKGFDEDSVASLSTTQDEMQDSHVENGVTNNSSHPFQGGGYMLAASYWPKDRVIINRLDSICQAVLKGKWPGHRRVYEPGSTVASFYTTKLLDNANSLCEDPSASPQGSKVAPGWGGIGQVGIIGAAAPMNSSQNPADTDTRVPVINLKDGTRLAGDDAPMRKDLDQWLREHPGFVADTGAFIPGVNKMQMQFHFQDGRPKQKRHRCRNPNKIDVNSLTGEERVQIINRRNARKGYLPESMFDRILTGPIVPEEVSRRGRRPKNPLAKAAAASSSAASALGLNPLLSNGLLSGMDLGSLQAFQQNLQSLQSLQLTAGLMGLPPDASNLAASNLAAMFPMMLSGMAGLPNLLSMSSLLGKPTQEAAGSSEEKTKGINNSGTCEQSAPAHTSETKGERTEGLSMTPSSTSSSASSATVTQSASAASAATSHPLSLNPLLLSSMLYPGMLLTPGLNLPVSATQLQSSNSDPSTLPSAAAAAPLPSGPAASQSLLTEMEQPSGKNEEEEDEAPEGALDDEEDDDEESAEPRENSGPEGSAKAESSSSESGSSSSSSDESDSSDED